MQSPFKNFWKNVRMSGLKTRKLGGKLAKTMQFFFKNQEGKCDFSHCLLHKKRLKNETLLGWKTGKPSKSIHMFIYVDDQKQLRIEEWKRPNQVHKNKDAFTWLRAEDFGSRPWHGRSSCGNGERWDLITAPGTVDSIKKICLELVRKSSLMPKKCVLFIQEPMSAKKNR